MFEGIGTIGDVVRLCLIQDDRGVRSWTTDQIIAQVVELFPEAQTSKKSVAWYRNELRQAGVIAKARKKTAAEKAAEKAAKLEALVALAEPADEDDGED